MRNFLVLTSIVVSALVLGPGCKTDDAVQAGSAATSSEPTVTPTEQGPPRRSAKIELPRMRGPAPSLERREPATADGDTDDAEARREAWRARREERREERRAMLDTDGDGTISEAERQAARARRTQEMRDRLDTDGDGKLTVAELEASRMARRVGDPSLLDTNGDGEISPEELDASMQRMRERVRDGRGGARGEGRRGRDRGPAGGRGITPLDGPRGGGGETP